MIGKGVNRIAQKKVAVGVAATLFLFREVISGLCGNACCQ